MKHIDYLYFNIYNYFYRVSQYRQSFTARIQAMYLFSLGSGGWLLLLQSLYLHLVKHTRFSSRSQSAFFAITLYILTAVLFNYIFIVKDRDQKIFGKYEELSNDNPRGRLHFIISISILIIPYLGLLAFAIFSPRHAQ
jgi:hypothetical protein